jgi:plasmid stability protein
MPTTITLKNIPDDIYASLREAADAHHRSLNGEAIACLQRVLLPNAMEPAERLNRARSLRSALPEGAFRAANIADAIRQGRA